MYRFLFLAIVSSQFIPLHLPAAEQTNSSDDYKLVWSDEFETPGQPDPKNWTYERGFVRNEEAQWYQPENSRCENGSLIIDARREQKKNPNYVAGARRWQRNREFAEYTSSSLTTRGLHQWTYGRFEMRGRIDTRDGLWPAFWTVGASGGWPAGGEIDIMEYYRGMLKANVAWAGTERRNGATWRSTVKQLDRYPADWSSKFHTWRMDWDEKQIQLFLDDVLLNKTDLGETINTDAVKTNPFHSPQYIILNLAIGGTEGGDPTKTEFPVRFEVDYVRVYQKTAASVPEKAKENPTPSAAPGLTPVPGNNQESAKPDPTQRHSTQNSSETSTLQSAS